eukprot:CAMPEP_0202061180 /NCGR_PEP_ID=MMETSP0963-20130614/40268_1 /ASSEMBLY_ACC=CAM_ASM_000494 /TAXON_ID=4773 /ORGANISM="Schizochytrium aggregatum, Strain ATCC28209" /LENGTH=126 /DNA_ID=CAMNT_0048627357 /DNA_START=138 /DNA_END=519 /DNA_ORIENTATION=+
MSPSQQLRETQERPRLHRHARVETSQSQNLSMAERDRRGREELLVVVRSETMMLFVPWRTTKDTITQNVVEHVWQVEPRVDFGQHVRDDDVVTHARERVQPEEVERQDVDSNLKRSVHQRVPQHLG